MQPLKIGVTAFFWGKPSGVANYIVNLIRRLPRIDAANEYFVFTTDENTPIFAGLPDNLHLVNCPVNASNPTGRRIWEQVGLVRWITEHGLDVFHSPMNILPLMCPCRTVVTILDCQYYKPESGNTFARRYYHKLFMKLSVAKADAILTISHAMKGEILRFLGGSPSSIFVSPLGQDFTAGRGENGGKERVETLLGTDRDYVLFTGFPQYRKNLVRLVRAFAEVKERLPRPCKLVFCGDISPRPESDYPNIRAAVDSLQLSDDVLFTDFLPDEDMRLLLANARLFAFPSLYEGFGLPVVEAMACGTPVAASDLPVMRELGGSAVEYFNPYDHKDIARGLLTALSDEERRARMRKDGMERALLFSWENTARRTIEAYRHAAGAGARRSARR